MWRGHSLPSPSWLCKESLLSLQGALATPPASSSLPKPVDCPNPYYRCLTNSSRTGQRQAGILVQCNTLSVEMTRTSQDLQKVTPVDSAIHSIVSCILSPSAFPHSWQLHFPAVTMFWSNRPNRLVELVQLYTRLYMQKV